jgi:putative ABC transport system permease protein
VWRVALKGLVQRKSRLIGTMLAIVLGVGFISGIYVLTDTIKKTFDDLFGSVYAQTDVVVQPKAELGGRLRNKPPRLDATLLDRIKAIDGVESAFGYIQDYAQAVDGRGNPVGGDNAPAFAISWSSDERVNPFRIAQGAAPATADEMAIDRTSFKVGKFSLGQDVSVLTSGAPKTYKLVGVMRFGTADSPAGASVIALAPDEAVRVLDSKGGYDQILIVAKTGVTQDALAERISPTVATDKTQVITGIQAAKDRQTDLRKQLNGFTSALLIFGFLSLFVGAFVIVNTFAIVVAQRRQELALLRAIGASRKQVRRSVVLEAMLIGFVAALIGLGVGFGIAQALKAAFGLFGFSLPTGALVLRPRTVVVALFTGVAVTIASALVPAWRASRIPPIAAMREAAIEPQRASRGRIGLGLVLIGVAAYLLVRGVTTLKGNAAAESVGKAGGATLIAAALLGPLLILGFAKLGRRVLKARGMAGELAAENVVRSPRRAAVTGFALTLGLSIVAALLVFAASFEGLLNRTVEGQFKGDFVVVSRSFIGFSGEVVKAVRSTPGVSAASPFRFGFDAAKPVNSKSKEDAIVAVDTTTIDEVVAVPMKKGRLRDIGVNEMAIGDTEATLVGAGVGDTVRYLFPTGEHDLKIVGIIDSAKGGGIFQGVTRVISLQTWDAVINNPLDSLVIAKRAQGANAADVKAAITATLKPYATTRVLDQGSYKAFVLKQVNGFLGFIFIMLFLSIVIAAVGVWNTLNLSVIERTREIGVLRGVGMSRNQVRTMVRWEAVLIAMYGAVIGIGIGVAFGVALVRSLRDQGFTVIAVPIPRLAVALLLAFLLGIVAAIGAARRAAKLDILKAIAVA